MAIFAMLQRVRPSMPMLLAAFLLLALPANAGLRISILAAGEPVDFGVSLPADALPDSHVGRGRNDIVAAWLAEPIRLLAERGVPVCAHLGLTPQAVNILGGYKVQGRQEAQARQMRADAIALEQAGAAMLLLECVPSELAAEITQAVSIPVIGIGAGSATDGQVLVMHDMLGLSLSGRVPKFVKNFMLGQPDIAGAFGAYVQAVKGVTFPGTEHGFSA